MKYVVGYDKGGKFIILYESNNKRLALLMCEKHRATNKEDVKIKKRA